MAFEKFKNFIAPVDDDDADEYEEELEYKESEAKPVSPYEPKKAARITTDAQMVLFEHVLSTCTVCRETMHSVRSTS